MRRERLSTLRLGLAGILVAALALSGCQTAGQSAMLGATIGAGVGGVAIELRESTEDLAIAFATAITLQDTDEAIRTHRESSDDNDEYVIVGALIGGAIGWFVGNMRSKKASRSSGTGLVLGVQEESLHTEFPIVSESADYADWDFYQGNRGIGSPLIDASSGGQGHAFDLCDSLMRLNGRTAAVAQRLQDVDVRETVIAKGEGKDWCRVLSESSSGGRYLQ